MENDNDEPRKRKPREKQFVAVSSSSINSAENNCTPSKQQDNCNAKDESMSTQDVKESKAGSRYSLRSQLKRPINSSKSDQPPEPLTKKPAKGSKKSSAVKLTQESKTPIKPRDERTTSEIALNIDLIVESLFRYMDCTTLKSCRLVCRRWKYFGAKEYQHRREITIQLSFGYVIDKSKKSVRGLLAVMQNSDPNTFPCASFDISTEELSSPRINNFFSVAEARNPIKKLCLTLHYEKKKISLKESTLQEDLRDVLFRQVPNLEDLKIRFCLPSHWHLGLSTLESGLFHLKNSTYLLPKLTSLDLPGGLLIPRRIFEDVMDAAVNLSSYKDSQFSPEQLVYFLDGNGRHPIHLLKNLSFLLYGPFVEVMERLLSQHGDDLKLESFYFVNPWTMINLGTEFWSRASSVISQLFISSASTLETMGIAPMRFLPGLAIPRLPNLNFIDLEDFVDENNVAHNFFFPSGFNLSKNFPNLSTVCNLWGSTLMSLEMLSITEPVTSVNHILINDKHGIDDDTRVRLYAAFPSAVLIGKGIQIEFNINN